MAKLHVLKNTELSEYCLNILEKHDIRLAREFVGAHPEKLMKILNLNLPQVKKIKNELSRLYGPTTRTLTDKLKEIQRQTITYGCSIPALDQLLLLEDNLCSQSFWEICGPTGVGKTQLAFSLVLNFILNHKLDVLYIDTKLDFSGARIKQILKARQIQPEMLVGIMSSIKVERVFSAQGVIAMLESLCTQLQLGNPDVITIKLIIIDSLPAVWFLLNATAHRLAGKWLLSRLNQLIRRLVQDYYIAVICVNLSLLPSNEENQKTSNSLKTNHDDETDASHVSELIDEDDMDMENKTSSLCVGYKPALGYSWLTKPRVRLSLEYPSPQDHKYSSLRVIKVIKSGHSFKDASCLVKIQDVGVVELDWKPADDKDDEDLTL